MYVTIRDARTGQPVTGKLVKDYSNGLTIEDPRGVLHYAPSASIMARDVEKPATHITLTDSRVQTRGDMFRD